MTCAQAESLLSAYLDGELDLPTCVDVDRHLAECRACQSQYQSFERLRQEIVAVDLRYEPAPEFARKMKTSLLPSRSWRVPSILSAAAIAALALLLIVPFRSSSGPSQDSREVLDSHLRSLTTDHLVDVPSSDRHTVKPWFEGKTSFSPPVLDLTSDGFPLIGGRLEVIHQQPAAVLVYKRAQHVINLYVSPSAVAETKITEEEISGYHLVHWTQKNLAYSAVSDLNAAELRTFSNYFVQR